jgi:cobalamin biosynthesis protein CobT
MAAKGNARSEQPPESPGGGEPARGLRRFGAKTIIAASAILLVLFGGGVYAARGLWGSRSLAAAPEGAEASSARHAGKEAGTSGKEAKHGGKNGGKEGKNGEKEGKNGAKEAKGKEAKKEGKSSAKEAKKPAAEAKPSGKEAKKESKEAKKESKKPAEGGEPGSEKESAEEPPKTGQPAYLGEGRAKLGDYSVKIYDPVTRSMLRADFRLEGVTACEDEAAFQDFAKARLYFFREQVMIALRSSEVADFADPQLQVLKRRLSARVNRAMGYPFVRSVDVKEFAIYESVDNAPYTRWQPTAVEQP